MKTIGGIDITVGMPATFQIGSDRYAGKVTRISPRGIATWNDTSSRSKQFDVKKSIDVDLPEIFKVRGGSGTIKVGIAETYLDPGY